MGDYTPDRDDIIRPAMVLNVAGHQTGGYTVTIPVYEGPLDLLLSLIERREMYRNAWPEQKRVIEKFFVRWRQLPPDRRLALKRQFAEWRGLPAAERDEQMMGWPFYNGLRPDEQGVIRWFLFSEPAPPRPHPGRSSEPTRSGPAGHRGTQPETPSQP